MKWNVFVGALAGLAGLMITGCGGAKDAETTILGFWTKSCYTVDGGYYTKRLIFKPHGIYYREIKTYSDEACTDLAYTERLRNKYTKGDETVDSNGSAAMELDIVSEVDDTNITLYTMYRLEDSNTLHLAHGREGHLGDTPETRKDVFVEGSRIYTRE